MAGPVAAAVWPGRSPAAASKAVDGWRPSLWQAQSSAGAEQQAPVAAFGVGSPQQDLEGGAVVSVVAGDVVLGPQQEDMAVVD